MPTDYKSSDSILDTVSVSVFWYIITAIFGTGLLYILLWSIQPAHNNLPAAIISIIFLFMFIISMILSKIEILRNGTLVGNSIALWVGVIFWSLFRYLITNFYSAGNKLFSLTADTAFFSTAVQSLPMTLQFVFNVIVAPIAEEMLWIVAIPYSVIAGGNYVAKSTDYKIFGNKYFQLIAMIAIGAPTFAAFHIGNIAITGFLIFVAVFRAILLLVVYLPTRERKYGFSVLPAFAIGAHIANNWIEFGLNNGLQLLNQNLIWVGLLAYVFILFTLILFIWSLFTKVKKGQWNPLGRF